MLIEAHGRSYEIEVDPESHIGKRIAETGKPFEWPLLERIYRMGLRGAAIDVGANIGNHALWFSIVCGLPTVAFEPITVDELRLNVEANNADVRIEAVALADADGVASDRGIRAGQKGAEPTDYEVWGFNHMLELGTGKIPVRTLDAYELDDVALIKVDVEGMEAAALRGGVATIVRSRPVIFAEALTVRHHEALAAVLIPLGYRMVERYSRGTPLEEWAC